MLKRALFVPFGEGPPVTALDERSPVTSCRVLLAPGEVAKAIERTALVRTGGGDILIGADLVEVSQVAEAIDRFGERYLARVFTDHERDCCVGSAEVQAAGLAARFAAKEATIKVLRPTDVRPDWRSIEVVRQAAGWCDIVLTSGAKDLAADAGIEQMALSLTHEGGIAGAVVVARCRPAGEPRGR